MPLPTVAGTRSGLFFQLNPGGLPSIADAKTYTGNIFFVMTGGTDAAGYGLHPDAPFATIDYAIGRCTASQGDVIFVMPGHTETIAAAAGIAADVAGISIIGLGNGANRPTITFSAVASTFAISAANTVVKNIIVTCTAATTKMFNITAAGVTLDVVDYVEGTGLPLQFVLTTAAADQLTIRNCYHNAATAGASAQIWVQLVGTDETIIEDNKFYLVLNNAAGSYTIRASTAVVRCQIHRNTVIQLGGATMTAAISLIAASTGHVTKNYVGSVFTTVAGSIALASAYGAENRAANTVNTNGRLEPAEDADAL